MKKTFTIYLFLAVLAAGANAQGYSLGLQVGNSFATHYGSHSFFVEASSMIPTSNDNRFEIDLGWSDHGHYRDAYGTTHRTGALLTSLSYLWGWHIVAGLGWYIGPSVALGAWFNGRYYDSPATDNTSSTASFTAGVGGTVGIEYNFDFPLQLSLAARPSLNVMVPGQPYMNIAYIGLGIRYRFTPAR